MSKANLLFAIFPQNWDFFIDIIDGAGGQLYRKWRRKKEQQKCDRRWGRAAHHWDEVRSSKDAIGGGAQRPILLVNELKKTDARSERARSAAKSQ